MGKLSVGVVLAMSIIFSVPVHSQTTSLPRFSGRNLRKITATTVTPVYPQDAINAHQTGVAVALVIVTEKGNVSKVDVLEAPSASIAASLSDALSQWRFQVATSNGRANGYTGKITYYFVFHHDKAAVLSPDEAPYIGRWPKKIREAKEDQTTGGTQAKERRS